ncbi:MAG: tRNA 2-selenouridine(34) synthase MnmH [Boseongicola sp.]|nr:MAG: tRNA 2-selenouridine(34) synthase MnmH [Boseongicola sp.]
MPFAPASLTDLFNAKFDTVIDVRAPIEYSEDCVPGAVNMPVLSDAERVDVGTIYKQESAFRARKLGAALVARNAASHIERHMVDFDGSWQPLVYCWRGGQRSGSFATILSQIGWRVQTLEGGYRTYRRLIVDALYDKEFPAPVILLDGNTGTGKTEVLRRIGKLGIQVLDLEGIANHRGSVLGHQGRQPSQKAFETRLAHWICGLDAKKPVIIEAESSRIGQLNIPPEILRAMKSARRIRIAAPVDERAKYLVKDYSDALADRSAVADRLDGLTALRGRALVETWQKGVVTGSFRDVAKSLIENHYDPSYAKARGRHEYAPIKTVTAEHLDDEGLNRLAEQVADTVNSGE